MHHHRMAQSIGPFYGDWVLKAFKVTSCMMMARKKTRSDAVKRLQKLIIKMYMYKITHYHKREKNMEDIQ